MSNFAVIKKESKGFALLEILLAFGVASFIIVGMVSLGISSVRAITLNRAYSEAGKTAQREAERIELMRDTAANWGDFYSSLDSCVSPSRCHIGMSGSTFQAQSGSNSVTVGNDPLIYYFTVTRPNVSRVDYVVSTTWTVGTVSKVYTIEGALSNWKEL